MNRKGQSLVLFVVLLPIIVLGIALVVDVGTMFNAKMRGNNLLREAKKENVDIEEYFTINDMKIDSIEVHSDKNCVIINSKVDSIFGRIAGIDEYDIKISDCD